MEDMLILVDGNDAPVGTDTKTRVHQLGLLHRAFSIFIFDRDGRWLLQRRALGKYHSAGLWSNSCCGHPRHGETLDAAASRRLREEMGIACDLRRITALTYRAPMPNGLIEHEYDHVFVGSAEHEPAVNTDEVDDWQWMRGDQVLDLTAQRPHDFTVWFREILARVRLDGAMPHPRAESLSTLR
ncbi:isopentenyl-diphosphate Delta-isomerase [Burkholderia pyrrocinia]|uniref:isopentenyl-diphosphate Delta-isomerase n=1 Tax=Burkholderia pyrrocinia TaxID=60550 RepID=UPI002AAFA7A0|nr:isopentenyl-diphosphate Delta-isomerase [Burkholderia pyrrocinia]